MFLGNLDKLLLLNRTVEVDFRTLSNIYDKLFAKIVHSIKPLTIFVKSFIVDVCQSSECASEVLQVPYAHPLRTIKRFIFCSKSVNSPFKRFYIRPFFQACVRNFKEGLLLKEKSGKVFQTFEKPIEETVVEPTFRNTAT